MILAILFLCEAQCEGDRKVPGFAALLPDGQTSGMVVDGLYASVVGFGLRIVYTVNVNHLHAQEVGTVKAVNLPEAVYADLVSVQKDLASMAGKPMSLGMAVFLLTAVYRAHLREPCARDAFRQRLSSSGIMSPEEFEKAWDIASQKQKGKQEE